MDENRFEQPESMEYEQFKAAYRQRPILNQIVFP